MIGRASFLLLWLLCAVLGALTSCKEPLPPYDDPRDLLDAYSYGLYVINRQENVVKAYLTVINTYDETFDAEAVLSGRIVLTWAKDGTFKKTFQLSPSLLIYARGYNAETGMLRFDPADSIRFGITWDMVADDGRRLFSLMSFFPDPECPARLISTEPVRFSIEGHALVYNRTGTVGATVTQFEFILQREFAQCRPPARIPGGRK
jgi:hypothetical protein